MLSKKSIFEKLNNSEKKQKIDDEKKDKNFIENDSDIKKDKKEIVKDLNSKNDTASNDNIFSKNQKEDNDESKNNKPIIKKVIENKKLKKDEKNSVIEKSDNSKSNLKNDLFTKVDNSVDNVDNSQQILDISPKISTSNVDNSVDNLENDMNDIITEENTDIFYYTDEDYEDIESEQWESIANIIKSEEKNTKNELFGYISDEDKKENHSNSSEFNRFEKVIEEDILSEKNEVIKRTKDALEHMRVWANDDNTVNQKEYKAKNFRQGERNMYANKNAEVKKDEVQTVQNIYVNSQMETDKLKTIFMVDEFSKTLPENLPADVKRTAVANIINVSSMKIENFLNDAYKRMDALNQVLENSVQKTEEIIADKKKSIKELEEEIANLEQLIMDREKFQDEQTAIIEYEVQRIVGIVDFIKPHK